MGKITEQVRLTNALDPSKTEVVEAVVDTGATLLVLPQDVIERLGLRKIRETKVRYANQEVQTKAIYGVVSVEIQGRSSNFDALAEVPGSQPLIGQVILEVLDLVIDPVTRKLGPNPQSPEMPLVEIL